MQGQIAEASMTRTETLPRAVIIRRARFLIHNRRAGSLDHPRPYSTNAHEFRPAVYCECLAICNILAWLQMIENKSVVETGEILRTAD